jgi:gamma-glutamyl:cysteine ligase YbdK (ATP-grasp superfamily)
MRTVGVEEELLLVDEHHDRLAPVASTVLSIAAAHGDAGTAGVATGSLVHEFQEHQLEAYTSPHHSMPMLEAELRSWRARASSAAAGAVAAGAATASAWARAGAAYMVASAMALAEMARVAQVVRISGSSSRPTQPSAFLNAHLCYEPVPVKTLVTTSSQTFRL